MMHGILTTQCTKNSSLDDETLSHNIQATAKGLEERYVIFGSKEPNS